MIELKSIKRKVRVGKEFFEILNIPKLKIETGELVAIKGPSGSGKTTLLNIIAGITSPSSGSYYCDGEEISKLGDSELAKFRNMKVGYVVQNFALIPEYSVSENIALPLKYNKKSKGPYKKKVESVLAMMEMKGFGKRIVYDLSGGQKQRVAIARAIVNDPEVILADEPTGALDSETGKKVMNELMRVCQKQKKTLIVVTHDDDVAEMLDRVIYIQDGQLI